MTHIVDVLDNTFETDIVNSDQPVIVDFWAPWCGPCKMFAPTFEATAPEYDGKMKFAKVNVDEAGESAAKFGVRSIPTIMLFKNGEVVDTHIGGMSQAQLKAFADKHC